MTASLNNMLMLLSKEK